MVAYRDITVDVVCPNTKRDRTAVGILNALTCNTGEVPAGDVDLAILQSGGDVQLKQHAIKGLRNIGYAIDAHKARHLSWYRLGATPDQYDQFVRRVVREAYSQQVTVCRTLAGAIAAGPVHTGLNASHQHAVMTALALGQQMGKSIQEVLDEVELVAAP